MTRASDNVEALNKFVNDPANEPNGSEALGTLTTPDGVVVENISKIASAAVAGVDGASFEWEGVYSSGTAYVVGDTVFNQNSSWICVSAVTGTAPPTLPTESNANWELMAKNGADGADGDGAGDLLSTNNLSDLANSSTARTNLGLSIGADVQAYSAAIDGTTASYLVAEQTKLGHVSVTQAVDLDQMETDISALANGMVYKSTWDASAGSFPGSGLAQIGWFYYVSVGGTVDSVTFSAGDNIVAIVNDSSSTVYAANWSKHDQTDAVQSVAGKIGTVTLALADITDAGDAAGLDEATTANFRANVSDRLLSTDQVWLAAAEVSLTDAASIAVDFSTGLNFGVTIADNRTLANPTNTKVGQAGFIRIAQDATGSRTLAFGTNYKFSEGTAPTMTTTANAEDLLFYSVLSSTKILINSVLDVK